MYRGKRRIRLRSVQLDPDFPFLQNGLLYTVTRIGLIVPPGNDGTSLAGSNILWVIIASVRPFVFRQRFTSPTNRPSIVKAVIKTFSSVACQFSKPYGRIAEFPTKACFPYRIFLFLSIHPTFSKPIPSQQNLTLFLLSQSMFLFSFLRSIPPPTFKQKKSKFPQPSKGPFL